MQMFFSFFFNLSTFAKIRNADPIEKCLLSYSYYLRIKTRDYNSSSPTLVDCEVWNRKKEERDEIKSKTFCLFGRGEGNISEKG